MTTARPARRAAIVRRSPARRARSLVVTGGHPSSDFHRFADVTIVSGLSLLTLLPSVTLYSHIHKPLSRPRQMHARPVCSRYATLAYKNR